MNYTQYSGFQDKQENADRIFELIDGEAVEKSYDFLASVIAARIGSRTQGFAEQLNTGYTTAASGGYIMTQRNIFIPDVGYISKIRLPELPEREAPVPPDLAVEVKSPTDSKRAMRCKAEKCLAYGTRLVWLVFPDEQEVEVYDARFEEVQNVGLNGTLDGGDVLPGFSLSVKDIFR